MQRNKTLSIRITEILMGALEERADELSCSKADLIEKALSCFLGVKVEEDCRTYSSLWDEIRKIESRLELRIVDLESKLEGK